MCNPLRDRLLEGVPPGYTQWSDFVPEFLMLWSVPVASTVGQNLQVLEQTFGGMDKKVPFRGENVTMLITVAIKHVVCPNRSASDRVVRSYCVFLRNGVDMGDRHVVDLDPDFTYGITYSELFERIGVCLRCGNFNVTNALFNL